MKEDENVKKGFTLIEIIVVIGIITALMLIAVPSILNSRGSLENIITEEEKKNIKFAAELLAIDLDDNGSNIYNCKTGSWVAESGNCEKNEENKWTSITISIDELIQHDYFEDKSSRYTGNLTITKNGYNYEINLDNVESK